MASKRSSELSMKSFSDTSHHMRSFSSKSDMCLSAFPQIETTRVALIDTNKWQKAHASKLAKQLPNGARITMAKGVMRMEFPEDQYQDVEEFIDILGGQEE